MKEQAHLRLRRIRRRLFTIIQIGSKDDIPSRLSDFILVTGILANITILFLNTFSWSARFARVLDPIENMTVALFIVEYFLRIWTADFLFPKKTGGWARVYYMTSFDGVISLLSILPYFLPLIFPSGLVAFRVLRVFRIFHLFRINAQYDAFNVVLDVLIEKKQQLFSSVVIILILMLSASLCIYSLEHEAQPEVFQNAFSGIWWAVSTLSTVGYGDIYPITMPGRCFAILITFLGIGLVAIPTGIVSAGFVEQYTRLKSLSDMADGNDMRFLMFTIEPHHLWVDRPIRDLNLPPELVVVVVLRGQEMLIPRGHTTIHSGDRVVLGALEFQDDVGIKLREFAITEDHLWCSRKLESVDVPDNLVVVAILRRGRVLVPKGSLQFRIGDIVTVCEKHEGVQPVL